MSIPGSATFLMLLAVISLQQALLLQAAPGIENAAYVSQDLWADESVPATWTAAVRRQRRHDANGPVPCGRHGRHWPGHGFGHGYGPGYGSGYGFGYGSGYGPGFGPGPGFGHGHGHGHGHGSSYSRSFGFGFPANGHGYNLNEPHYKVPLAPFKDNQQANNELSSSSLAPPSSKTTATPATTASTTTPTTTTSTTTEDATLAIDLRSGLS